MNFAVFRLRFVLLVDAGTLPAAEAYVAPPPATHDIKALVKAEKKCMSLPPLGKNGALTSRYTLLHVFF